MIKISPLIFLLLFSSFSYAETYKWVDEDGIMHFSDQPITQENSQSPKTIESPTISARDKERGIVSICLKGRRLFKAKQYEAALPYFHQALREYQALYSAHPNLFKKRSNNIGEIRLKLASYYRWKQQSPDKAIREYEKLIETMGEFGTDENRIYPVWFLMGEIYEKELHDYEAAHRCYVKVVELLSSQRRKIPNPLLIESSIDWHRFLAEKVEVLHLEKNKPFPRRTIKYPSLAYRYFLSFFVQAIAYSDSSFLDEDFMNHAADYRSIEAFDKLAAKYPTSYQILFLGIDLFYRYLSEKDIDAAMQVADKLFAAYPDDLNMVMLQFKIADIYKDQNQMAQYETAAAKGRQMAEALNIEIVQDVDTRFSNPEKTWRLFVSALERKDVDEAVECFLPNYQRKYREFFTAARDKLDEMAADMTDIRKIEATEKTARYVITRAENGRKLGYDIEFVNILGEWKMASF